MPKKAHDPLDQNAEPSDLEIEEAQFGADDFEREAPEEAAVNIDNETAQEATDYTAITEEDEISDPELEKEAELVDQAVERKHKNRESTSEKAKKASEVRQAEGKPAEPVSKRYLDPLRLRGKKYRAKAAMVDKNKQYSLEEAVKLVKQLSTATFDGAVEFHAKVKSENVRGTVVLPHGTGKSKKVAVADEDTLEAIAAGKLDFDVLLATPAQMPKLAKFAKVLGPKGLMPSPKAGTVTDDLEKTAAEIGGGRIEYRADKNGVVHASIGRLSFSNEQLIENFRTLEQILISAKPLSVNLAPTMGPAVRIALG